MLPRQKPRQKPKTLASHRYIISENALIILRTRMLFVWQYAESGFPSIVRNRPVVVEEFPIRFFLTFHRRNFIPFKSGKMN